jgi:hypothetical protein
MRSVLGVPEYGDILGLHGYREVTNIPSLERARDVYPRSLCGSGSTLAAAQELERRFMLIELDAAHHRTARQRLEIAGPALKSAA